jgi:hypothetical protein
METGAEFSEILGQNFLKFSVKVVEKQMFSWHYTLYRSMKMAG